MSSTTFGDEPCLLLFTDVVINHFYTYEEADFPYSLCRCRFAFAQIKHLSLTVRFHAEQGFLQASSSPTLQLVEMEIY